MQRDNSWRPEEWENPYWLPPRTEDDIGKEFRYKREGISKGETFEAGAEAMLKALFKMAKESPTSILEIRSPAIGGNDAVKQEEGDR